MRDPTATATDVHEIRPSHDGYGTVWGWRCGACGRVGDPVSGILDVPRTGICNACGAYNDVGPPRRDDEGRDDE